MASASLIPKVYYPDSDGEPMSDNTLQFDWISIVKWGGEFYFAADPTVFVAGDHLIYAVEGDATIRMAPDVYFAFGRPKGYRGSYRVWEEMDIFPQVVIEVWSPNNRYTNMRKKFDFYEKYGAEEYYIIYPEFPAHLEGYLRNGDRLVQVDNMQGFVSPRLGFRFGLQPDFAGPVIHGPDGRVLQTPTDVAIERDQIATERDQIATERDQIATERERLAQRLRELGIDPDKLA